MPLFTLPAPHDVADIIADQLDFLRVPSLAPDVREQVIDNCIIPVVLAMHACEMVCAAGELEQRVFAAFIGTLAAQADVEVNSSGAVKLRRLLN
ncbi:hypothetical protein CAter282_0012 [Collimonas arenae]|uniref:Uncharacterized protein n=1 Tax=Collimonas arenae TaxID=279058 RepID=A0A127QCX1_9BURK|nr:hypothetical protein [Collimonas arenae]AMO97974.1 hypothetical protein CAter10_0013 [Collimonas arenae]AMP07836.1 hypothetical protein CAter282_0012 [Collimonas arenae]